MSKRKCLSVEEKRIKLLDLFHETCEVFQLKDLERIAPVEKGIVMQSVKTTLQELVDNGEVRSEKMSGSTYYWAFPSDALHRMRQQLEAIEELNKKTSENIKVAKQRLEAAEPSDSANQIHAEVLARELEVLKKERDELQQKLATNENKIDYKAVEMKEQSIKNVLEAANRWTDNIFNIKYWCKQKFNKEDKELDKGFGIPEDFDYLDS